MRRRSFLAAIAAAFVAPDPEKLLWQPGKKLISIPSPPKVGCPNPVLWSAIVEDVTCLSDGPWRKHLVIGYDILMSDGTVLRSFGETAPSLAELHARWLATRRPPLRRFPQAAKR